MNTQLSTALTLTLALSTLLASTAVAAPSLQTFTMATTGQSNYPTYGTVSPVFTNFGGWGTALPGDSTASSAALSSYDISGNWRLRNATGTAPITDAQSISGSGKSSFGNWNYTGATTATAQPGQLKSASSATHTGNGDNATVNSAESYAMFDDILTPNSPNVTVGANGMMRLALTIDGSFSINGKGTAGMIFRYDYGDPRAGYPAINQTLLESFIDLYGNGYQQYGVHSSFGSFVTPPGMSTIIGPVDANGTPAYASFGGTSTVYADVPITFGSGSEFRMGLFTWIQVGNGTGTMDSSFGDTATITGIQLFDANGNPVNDFSLSSGSGAQYSATGVTLAPEPMSALLLTPAALLLLRRKR